MGVTMVRKCDNHEKIGKVSLDYTFYSGNDEYSDGDVEDTILDIVKNNSDFDNIVCNSTEFPVFYHLSKNREFITEPMEISKSDSVLEIGAGCGAISGALADRAKQLKCIELSKKRSLINAYKNKEHDNINIIVGNFENIKISDKYDVVTLIGVLEYAASYLHSENPYLEMLIKIKSMLNCKGRVYIAIENRLGAKYFAGCKEDHTFGMFDGILNYPHTAKIRTFSYYELQKLFLKAGFESAKFYYPYPDYKFPHYFFTDDMLPEQDEYFEFSSNYYSERRAFFNEAEFLKTLDKNEYRIFANSYLICLEN